MVKPFTLPGFGRSLGRLGRSAHVGRRVITKINSGNTIHALWPADTTSETTNVSHLYQRPNSEWRFRGEPPGEGRELAVGERGGGLDDGTLSLFGFATIRMQALGFSRRLCGILSPFSARKEGLSGKAPLARSPLRRSGREASKLASLPVPPA